MALAHKRERQALACLLKKMQFSPIVSIQGPRQCGKSFLAREILPKKIEKSTFVSLDEKKNRAFAESNPETFLTQGLLNGEKCLIIDEAQKAPDLFDEIKAMVDKKRVPGQFVLLGSTEFSSEVKIRESLTGRLSRLRLFPFNASEAYKLALNPQKKVPFCCEKPRIKRIELLKYLNNGGFPGIFSVRSDSEKITLFSDWLSLTCERDIHQIKKYKLDSDVCRSVIESIAVLDEPSALNISRRLGFTVRGIEKYLHVLKILFVVFEVKPFRGSAGKSLYYLSDVGLAQSLEASFEKRLTTWFYLEMLSQSSYKGLDLHTLCYFKPGRGLPVQFAYEDSKEIVVVKIISHEGFDERDFFIFDDIEKKLDTKKKVRKLALSATSSQFQHQGVQIYPWESIV